MAGTLAGLSMSSFGASGAEISAESLYRIGKVGGEGDLARLIGQAAPWLQLMWLVSRL